jgi:hypothetical protein
MAASGEAARTFEHLAGLGGARTGHRRTLAALAATTPQPSDPARASQGRLVPTQTAAGRGDDASARTKPDGRKDDAGRPVAASDLRARARVRTAVAARPCRAVQWRLFAAGLPPLVTELERPLVVRRTVSFAQAVLGGRCRVEGVEARRCADLAEADICLRRREAVPVLVDPALAQVRAWRPHVVVDGRMAKAPSLVHRGEGPYVIGVGPGCAAGDDVDIVVESLRGHRLGHLIRSGPAAGLAGPHMTDDHI